MATDGNMPRWVECINLHDDCRPLCCRDNHRQRQQKLATTSHMGVQCYYEMQRLQICKFELLPLPLLACLVWPTKPTIKPFVLKTLDHFLFGRCKSTSRVIKKTIFCCCFVCHSVIYFGAWEPTGPLTLSRAL